MFSDTINLLHGVEQLIYKYIPLFYLPLKYISFRKSYGVLNPWLYPSTLWRSPILEREERLRLAPWLICMPCSSLRIAVGRSELLSAYPTTHNSDSGELLSISFQVSFSNRRLKPSIWLVNNNLAIVMRAINFGGHPAM